MTHTQFSARESDDLVQTHKRMKLKRAMAVSSVHGVLTKADNEALEALETELDRRGIEFEGRAEFKYAREEAAWLKG